MVSTAGLCYILTRPIYPMGEVIRRLQHPPRLTITGRLFKEPQWIAMLEIERKFLIHDLPPDLLSFSSVRIYQGYLMIGDLKEIRLRRREVQCSLTVKQGQGLSRTEVEVDLSEEQFNTLWPITQNSRIEKIRYSIPYQDRIIELDVYKGGLAGHCLVEVEFDSGEAASIFQLPEWFGEDVTADERYKNKNLAQNGWPQDET